MLSITSVIGLLRVLLHRSACSDAACGAAVYMVCVGGGIAAPVGPPLGLLIWYCGHQAGKSSQ